MLLKSLAVCLTVAALSVGAADAADCTPTPEAESGKVASRQCLACHVLDFGVASRPTGPNIHDVFGSLPGSRKDFLYSEGIIGAAAKGAVWSEDALFDYLVDPKLYLNKINGAEVSHKMNYHLKDEQKRKEVIAYLKAIKGKPECN